MDSGSLRPGHVTLTDLGSTECWDQPSHENSTAVMVGLAVSIRNLYVSYKPRNPILKNLNMTVEEGSIYTLLGDSGCGKSTLLNTIVGLKKFESGYVSVLNKPVNGVIGRRVGFMPQDTALYDQLSIAEMMKYFGKLYGMSGNEIEEQVQCLIKLLELPSEFRLVKNLSGGMQRRCSLAVTLIHQPQLVILDEPTVGLDPLLRESIWEYLQKMVQSREQTIIVTTHYLEETKYANTIGLMRKGRLIAEECPRSLLQRYDSQLLQEVVLKLCYEDETNLARSSEVVLSHNRRACSRAWSEDENKFTRVDTKGINNSNFVAIRRIQAFSTVIWLTFLRHPVILGIMLFLPISQLILSLFVMGTHPRDVRFGVVNDDNVDCFGPELNQSVVSAEKLNFLKCDISHLSCDYIEKLSNSTIMNIIPTETEMEAIAKVKTGELWGYFYFPSNYSKHLGDFWLQKIFSSNTTLSGSRVKLRLDMSNYVGSSMAIKASYKAYNEFLDSTAISCGVDPRVILQYLLYKKLEYGDGTSSPTAHWDYYIPVVLLSIIFEVSIYVSSILLIGDRKQGTMDRARVAGLSFNEIIASHVVTQGSVIIGQIAICSIIMFLGFNFVVKGSRILYIFILFLAGLSGTSFGIFLGVFLREEVEAVFVIIFIFFLRLTYEGALWPVEGMFQSVQIIAKYIFPSTLLIESLRSVIYRGVGLFHLLVWPGITVNITWTIAIFLLSIIFVALKNK